MILPCHGIELAEQERRLLDQRQQGFRRRLRDQIPVLHHEPYTLLDM